MLNLPTYFFLLELLGMDSKFIEIENYFLYEDIDICSLSKSIEGFYLCNECLLCEEEPEEDY